MLALPLLLFTAPKARLDRPCSGRLYVFRVSPKPFLQFLCGIVVFRRRRIQMSAGVAGACVARAVEPVEYGREVTLDAVEHEILLIQLVIAAFAKPQEPVFFMCQASAFDHQPDRVGHALWRVGYARW